MRILPCALLSAIVAGCGIAAEQQRLEETKSAQQEINRCGNQKNKPVLPAVRCVNSAMIKVAHRLGGRDVDVAQFWAADRISVAAEFDQGKLTPEQYEARMLTIEAKLTSEVSRRDQIAMASAQADNNARAAAVGQALQNWGNSMAAQSRQPVQTNCRRVLDQVQCTTY